MRKRAWPWIGAVGLTVMGVLLLTGSRGRAVSGLRVSRGDLVHTIVASGRGAAAARSL